MTLPTQKELHELVKVNKDLFLNLAARWDDEKEYENPEDYFEVVSKKFSSFDKGFVKNKKLNFEFTCQEGRIHVLCHNGEKIEAFFTPTKEKAMATEKKQVKPTEKVEKKQVKPTEKVEKKPAKKAEKKPAKKAEKVEKAEKPAKKVEKAEKKPTEKVEKVAKRKIADVIREGLKAGLDKKVVLENVKKEFPSCNTNIACIAWYKSTMKAAGEL